MPLTAGSLGTARGLATVRTPTTAGKQYAGSQNVVARTTDDGFCTFFVNWCDSELGVHFLSSPFILNAGGQRREFMVPAEIRTGDL
jgi:hypothetical protein